MSTRRPLSPMERWYWICDQISPLNVIARVRVTGTSPACVLKGTFATSDVAKVPLSTKQSAHGACTTEDLERGAAKLVEEHPLLRVSIAAKQDGSRPRFVRVRRPRIPIRTVRSDWEHEVNEVELVTPVDWRSGPLARIVHVTGDDSHDVILTLSHVIADGTTAMELLRRLVELAAGTRAEPRLPLPAPEAMLPRRINGLHAVASAVADQVIAAFARPTRLIPDTPVPPEQRRTRLIHRELDAVQLDALTTRCRQEGVTVHSALSAALAMATSEVVSAYGRYSNRKHSRPLTCATTITIGSPVDFRAELEPPVGKRDAGAYVATVPSHVKVGPDLWTTARAAQRDLRRRRRFRQHLALVWLLRLMSPRSVRTSGRTVAAVDRMGPGNVCLSNLGRVDFPARAGRWELSGAQFVAGISVSGYLVATVNTSHAALHWNFTYVDGAVTAERAERIADRAMRVLLDGQREGDHGEQSRRGPGHRRVVGVG